MLPDGHSGDVDVGTAGDQAYLSDPARLVAVIDEQLEPAGDKVEPVVVNSYDVRLAVHDGA